MRKNFSIKNLDELENWVAEFILGCNPQNNATIVTLSGDLGAGKTAWVKAAARALGINEDITSPTFVIQKEYDLQDQKFAKMIHIDAYRLESAAELEYLGWKDIVADPGNIIFLEWPEMVEGINISGAINIQLSINDNESRKIEIKK